MIKKQKNKNQKITKHYKLGFKNEAKNNKTFIKDLRKNHKNKHQILTIKT
jgi:hypothetical protein